MEDEAICKVATITPVIYYPRVSQKAASALCKDTDRVSNRHRTLRTYPNIPGLSKASFIAKRNIYLSSSSKIGLSSPEAMVSNTVCNPISSQEREKQKCSKERLGATKTATKGFLNFAILSEVACMLR